MGVGLILMMVAAGMDIRRDDTAIASMVATVGSAATRIFPTMKVRAGGADLDGTLVAVSVQQEGDPADDVAEDPEDEQEGGEGDQDGQGAQGSPENPCPCSII